MIRIRKSLIIFLLLFGIVLIISSTISLNANLYRYRLDSQRSDNWRSQDITVTQLTDQIVGTNSCMGGTSFKDVPLVVNYMKDSTGSLGKSECPAVKVSVENIRHGIMWTPIIKHFKFESNVPVKFERILFKPFGDSTQVVMYHIAGSVIVTGEMTVYGFCSYKEARRIMIKSVIDNVYASVRNEMDSKK